MSIQNCYIGNDYTEVIIGKLHKDITSITTIHMVSFVFTDIHLNDIQYGKNNHIEYKWSTVQQEKILQLFYQLVRTTCRSQLERLSQTFKSCYVNGSNEDKKILLKMIAHTRDIENGKGEYRLSYILLKELMSIDRTIFVEIMKRFVGYKTKHTMIPYGSWKDIKYYMNEINSCPIELVKMINDQVRQDAEQICNDLPCSLVAKWIPRETSRKFGWIHVVLAKDYFSIYGGNGWSISSIKKAQTHYRQLVSHLNNYIDTIQIKQCGHVWNRIDFDKVTGVTMLKQMNSFLNNNTWNNDVRSRNNDRVECRINLLTYMDEVKDGIKTMKGKHIGIVDYIKLALNICNSMNKGMDITHEKTIINELWKRYSKQTRQLDNIIALVDVSGPMESDSNHPLCAAIGLGLYVAENSTLGKRLLMFANKPTWINLDDCADFVDSVKKIKDIERGTNANFYRAMELILDTIIENSIPAEDVNKLVLIVFSDMQIDAYDHSEPNLDGPVRRRLEEKFHDTGVIVCGTGYKVPHVIFWNVKSTNGFPEVSYQENVTMLSGYSPMLLNAFVDKGIYGIKNMTPWSMLTHMLDKPRYNDLEKLVE